VDRVASGCHLANPINLINLTNLINLINPSRSAIIVPLCPNPPISASS